MQGSAGQVWPKKLKFFTHDIVLNKKYLLKVEDINLKKDF